MIKGKKQVWRTGVEAKMQKEEIINIKTNEIEIGRKYLEMTASFYLPGISIFSFVCSQNLYLFCNYFELGTKWDTVEKAVITVPFLIVLRKIII